MDKAVTMRLAHGPSKKFRVVCFLEETTKDGRHVVDLVPVNWISFSSENSGLCSYPPPPYTNLINMVKRMNSPGLLWKQYPVRVIGKADTYEEGKLKVLKAERTMTVSTDEEGQGNRVHAKSNESLEDVPQFPTVSDKDECGGTKGSIARPVSVASLRNSFNDSGDEAPAVSVSSEEPTLITPPRKKNKLPPAVSSDESIDTPKSPLPKKKKGHKKTSTPQRVKETRNETTPVIASAVRSPDFDLKTFLIGMESRITDRIDKLKRSTTHESKKIKGEINELRAALSLVNEDLGDTSQILDFEKKWSLPFGNLEDFEAFEEFLVGENLLNFSKVLRSLWVPVGSHGHLSRSLQTIIERYIAKEVALKYSAQGKGKLKKMNFSATQFYAALESMVLATEKGKHIDAAKIKLALGKILANAGDWDGGRLLRAPKPTDTPKEATGTDLPVAA